MRYLAYIDGFEYPVVQHIDDTIKGEIAGGKFRNDGSIAIHTLLNGGDDAVIIIPPDRKWLFQSLEEAMNARNNEISANKNCYDIVKPGVDKRIVGQEMSALWGLGLDCEPEISTKNQGKRIATAREFLEKSAEDFAEETGITAEQLNMIESDTVLASYGYFDTIEKVYPNIRSGWLKNGCGEMVKRKRG